MIKGSKAQRDKLRQDGETGKCDIMEIKDWEREEALFQRSDLFFLTKNRFSYNIFSSQFLLLISS